MKDNIDSIEINKFSESAVHWWDQDGPFKTLHQVNPLRLNYLKSKVALSGKKVIDIGCGGGILTESLAKNGAHVTGIDMSTAAIEVARLRQLEVGTTIDYRVCTAEAMAEEFPQQYDIVTCLEMLEHVPHPIQVIQACSKLVKPNGHLFFSTLNRTLKSYLYAIVAAEYILKLLPLHTHDYAKFIKPHEFVAWARGTGLNIQEMVGLAYNPLTQQFKLSKDISVNYLIHATL